MSAENKLGTVSLEHLLEEEKSESLAEKIEKDRYKAIVYEDGLEVVDTDEKFTSREYQDIESLKQDLEAYDADASGRYGMIEKEDSKIIYDRQAGDNLVRGDNAVDLRDMT